MEVKAHFSNMCPEALRGSQIYNTATSLEELGNHQNIQECMVVNELFEESQSAKSGPESK